VLDLSRRLGEDIRQFADRNHLSHVIVLNVSSSEPMPPLGPEHASWSRLKEKLVEAGAEPVPASSIYGLAAMEQGYSYVNFTPSLGLDSPGLDERARESGILYMGRDGKTGETLMKAVLAPVFVRRNLQVLSWVGHNILGNRDGLVLQDPINKQGKLDSKGHLLSQILGYEPQTLVSIEHIESLGDWKTAWDHIHYKGFLDTKMSVQFIWQGCDSLLAAPLAIDLVRWTELAHRRAEQGCMTHLASYFKTPMHVSEQDFFRQWQMLEAYAANG
jgi:myo-inositol-1-phosphate synthase